MLAAAEVEEQASQGAEEEEGAVQGASAEAEEGKTRMVDAGEAQNWDGREYEAVRIKPMDGACPPFP